MNRFVQTAVAAAMSVLGAAGAASATTVTFDGLTEDLFDESYSEQGVTVSATVPGYILGGGPGSVHLDDDYAYTPGVIFTAGSVFDVLGFSFTSLGFAFFDEAPEVIGNIILRGFLDGVQVVRDRVTMSPVFGTVQDIVLGEAFRGLDAFSIEILYPRTEAWCDAPCGHIDLDSVTFAGIAPVPVPVPATAFLSAAALLLLAGFGRARRKR